MPFPRPAQALRAVHTLNRTSTTSVTAKSTPQQQLATRTRSFSSTIARKGGDAHGDHYEPPSGWLFGVKPGEKAEKEGWESLWVYGFFGSLALGVVGYAFKPDTSIQTWALEEARRRLEAEGILKEPESKS